LSEDKTIFKPRALIISPEHPSCHVVNEEREREREREREWIIKVSPFYCNCLFLDCSRFFVLLLDGFLKLGGVVVGKRSRSFTKQTRGFIENYNF